MEALKITNVKKCSNNAKTKLFREKHTELTAYYRAECLKLGVSIVKQGGAVSKGEPRGKERQEITLEARGIAETKIRKEFYDRYLEVYEEELAKAGLKKYQSKAKWYSLVEIERLEAEVARLGSLLVNCKCEGQG